MTYNIEFFSGNQLRDELEARGRRLVLMMESISDEQFVENTDGEILQYVLANDELEPLQLDLKQMTKTNRPARDYGQQVSRAMTFSFYIPFTGSVLLWRIAPSTCHLDFPAGAVDAHQDGLRGNIILSVTAPLGSSEELIKQQLNSKLYSIQRNMDHINSELLTWKQTTVRSLILLKISERRVRMKQFQDMQQLFADIPLRQNDMAPKPTPVLLKKQVDKKLRSPSEKLSSKSYQISDSDYMYILQILRHEGASFERTPVTFAKLHEEDLRNVMLAHLNGHYYGQATGETFRKTGKTDICIEFENRAAFVAECKKWGGEKVMHDAMFQLLSYVTWRDSKTALVLFSYMKRFSEVRAKVPEILASFPHFTSMVPNQAEGEWQVVVKHPDDPDRLMTVHVFLFDLQTTDK